LVNNWISGFTPWRKSEGEQILIPTSFDFGPCIIGMMKWAVSKYPAQRQCR
jgi:hypothetical protein